MNEIFFFIEFRLYDAQVLQMGNYLDINRIKNLLVDYGISEKLNELTSQIVIDKNFDIFPPQTRDGIINLQNSELKSFDSHKFFDNVSTTEYVKRSKI